MGVEGEGITRGYSERLHGRGVHGGGCTEGGTGYNIHVGRGLFLVLVRHSGARKAKCSRKQCRVCRKGMQQCSRHWSVCARSSEKFEVHELNLNLVCI